MHALYPPARLWPALALVVLFAVPASAQDSAETAPPAGAPDPSVTALPIGTNEWTLAGAAGWGRPIFGYGTDNAFAFPSLSWARVLTRPAGHGALRGQFEWGIEVIPLFGQYHPESALGVGVSPLVWRWHFMPRGPIAPYAELGGGVLWTDVDVPSDTTRANYTAHVTLAVRLAGAKARGAIIGYRFEHISNGNRADTNPSVNAHTVIVGWSLFHKP